LPSDQLIPEQIAGIQHDQPPIAEIRPRRTVRHIPLQPHQLTDRVTASKDVFVLSHVGVPRAKAEDWWLDIAGLVDTPRRLRMSELYAMPKRTVTALHECAGFPLRPDIATRRYANVVWGGVDLNFLLQTTGIKREATFLWSYGIDKGVFEDCRSTVYVKDMPLSRLARGEVLLAYEMNGESMDAEHGFPLRLVIPGYYGTNLVKWLYRLELSDRRPDSPFTTKYYNDPVPPTPDNPAGAFEPLWELPPESVIVSPAQGDILQNKANMMWGWAWAGAGLAQVEVSADGGRRWVLADLELADGYAWQQFTYSWTPSASGTFCLMSRAHDKRGLRQPQDSARNAIYRVEVHVQ
jgi:sulfane dehydrogenase subunit SoxC